MIKSRKTSAQRRPDSQPKALILTPTRELCNQVIDQSFIHLIKSQHHLLAPWSCRLWDMNVLWLLSPQITTAISELDEKVKCLSLYGGRPFTAGSNSGEYGALLFCADDVLHIFFSISDRENLRRGVDVVCATPGRLRDHIRRKTISLEKLEFLVLDEADEMLKVNALRSMRQLKIPCDIIGLCHLHQCNNRLGLIC